LLRGCYEKSLALAAEAGAKELAFPAISTGIFGYPPDLAAQVAIDAVAGFLGRLPQPERVIFCCFDEAVATIYRKALAGRL
jgi:O-acetyl-ADP-ribose deacetylase (regulator of RNase III)